MSVRNKLAKGVFYIGVALLTGFQSYVIGLLLSGTFISPVLAVWSSIRPLPAFVAQKLWLLYLLAGLPTGIAVAIYTISTVTEDHSKKHKKQDNGNH